MKKLTKLAAAALTGVALLIGTNVNAQTTPSSKLRFGIGLEAGAPTGNAHTTSNFELGGTGRLQYGTSDHFALTLTSGYYNFFGKDYTVGTATINGPSYGLVPVKVGLKAFFSNNVYFSAEAGAGFETKGSKNTKLILAPGLGWANSKWDVGVRYEDFSGQSNSYGLVGLRLAYGFEL
ncbi:MAG: hypothetical protein JWQ34_2299 [Mucilaginibacter sp.]|uniref:hypothetical protein n=1 Tax=Mucilaginibacter sp. TaxID=1882438 RepID=UPI002623F186|nr:hypothetical protein [Mucilaginibacter sp.]MDB5004074.1 hypothetical protein [Mucilaginibacter sp.]